MDSPVSIAKIAIRSVIIAGVAVCCLSFQAPATFLSAPSCGDPLRASSGMDPYSRLVARNEDRDEASGNNGYRKNYRQWQNLPPEEKSQLRHRMHQYKQMPPRDKQQYQQKLKQWKKLPPEDRRQIQQSLKGGKDLSPEEKEAIRRRMSQQ